MTKSFTQDALLVCSTPEFGTLKTSVMLRPITAVLLIDGIAKRTNLKYEMVIDIVLKELNPATAYLVGQERKRVTGKELAKKAKELRDKKGETGVPSTDKLSGQPLPEGE